ncbi:hypothetical protein AFR_12060 [Actinoplanes friuliensis DSM 7358]|uniref:Fibronectin type-III domain-containing protein n=1 Tax=Actinoplanes friuliensis DSM 7358 TaxID=1246995 RepID=U5VV10_9ACTN|nr:hypothetical protein AFR_12060 [Actinoplanes friuliensis DSM 7358]
MQQLASVHLQGGDQSGARRVLEEAFAAGQWRLGDADPVMLAISFDLGVVAEEMENRHEARRAFTRVATHGPAALGADHWAVVRARSYLGEDPPTVRMELSATDLQRIQVPPQRKAPQDQQVPVAEPAPRHFPAPAPTPQPQPSYERPAPPPQPSYQQPAPRPSYEQPTPQPSYQQPAPQPSYDQPEPRFYEQSRFEQQPMPQIISAPPITSAAPAQPDSSYARKAPAMFAAIAAVFGVIIAVVALVIVIASRGDDPDSDVPTLAGPAPSDVRMRDYGSSVQLFWSDPANGKASFVVTGGRPGQQLQPMGQVGPTTTSFDLNGLNADLDYCFAIVAVYTTSQFSTSPQTCTSRSTGSVAPSPSKR